MADCEKCGKPMVCHFDGCCEPNPGRMGFGWTIGGESFSHAGGYGTNNEAEYGALLALLTMLKDRGISGTIYGDSELVINQLNGDYAVKAGNLYGLHAQAAQLIAETGSTLAWCPREENDQADKASASALGIERHDLSKYTRKIGDLDPSLSAVKIGKRLAELGLRDQDGNPTTESGIRIFYRGFWTNFWHVENCRKALTPKQPEPEEVR